MVRVGSPPGVSAGLFPCRTRRPGHCIVIYMLCQIYIYNRHRKTPNSRILQVCHEIIALCNISFTVYIIYYCIYIMACICVRFPFRMRRASPFIDMYDGIPASPDRRSDGRRGPCSGDRVSSRRERHGKQSGDAARRREPAKQIKGDCAAQGLKENFSMMK